MSTTRAPNRDATVGTEATSATPQDQRPAPAQVGPESAFGAAVKNRGALSVGGMLALQAAAGNRAVVGLVQAKRARSSTDDSARVHEAARVGIAGGSGELPHLGRIQQSFGRHDVTGVMAHTGAQATAGARSMGAAAFTIGDHVAFDGQADLFTAAHEAAHVVQQRSGVHLPAGVGAVGDAYERHADAVAGLVEQGRSAEAMLDLPRRAGGTGVQRRVMIGGGGKHPPDEYGPEHKPLQELRQLISNRHVTLDGAQQQKLADMWSSGTHSFATIDYLIRDVFGRVPGLQPSTLLREGNKSSLQDDSNQRWFVSRSHVNAVPPEDRFPELATQQRAKFLVQCAVAGGELYRLILGGRQPMVGYTEIQGEPHRASREVAKYQEWPLEPVDHDEIESPFNQGKFDDLQNNRNAAVNQGHVISNIAVGKKYPLIEGSNQVFSENKAKPIEGLLSVFTMALFLGDVDMNAGNVGLVETEHSFEAVKLDPEASFSRFFFDQKAKDVEKTLKAPEDQGNEFTETFAGGIAESVQEDEKPGKRLQALLHSEAATKEMFRTIWRILSTPAEVFDGVIERCFSDEFALAKGALKQAIRNRCAVFAQAAQQLPGWPEYLIKHPLAK